MTDTEVSVETIAHRIAARGRDALVERLRTAYDGAAAAHADLISLDPERIDALVQSAADRADGLQWRRALADVAAEELGVDATEALSHPAVARAQELVGAPSYEQSLAELIARPVPPPSEATGTGGDGHVPDAVEAESPESGTPTPEPPAPEPPTPSPEPERPTPEPMPAEDLAHEPADSLETVEADDVVLELLPEPDPIEYETEVYEVEAAFAQEDAVASPEQRTFEPHPAQTALQVEEAYAPEPESEAPAAYAAEPHPEAPTAYEPEPATELLTAPAAEPSPLPAASPVQEDEFQFPAIHLGGVANLPTKREGLNVRLSADGLDILQGERNIIGRLIWDEIEALEVPHLRARRRQKQVRARLVVRTPHGDASFEVPEISAEELRDRVEPLMERFGSS
jgi:hypothetical protein